MAQGVQPPPPRVAQSLRTTCENGQLKHKCRRCRTKDRRRGDHPEVAAVVAERPTGGESSAALVPVIVSNRQLLQRGGMPPQHVQQVVTGNAGVDESQRREPLLADEPPEPGEIPGPDGAQCALVGIVAPRVGVAVLERDFTERREVP